MFRVLTPILIMGVQHPKHVELPKKNNKLNKSHLVGKQLLNSIHDARTHVYKVNYVLVLYI